MKDKKIFYILLLIIAILVTAIFLYKNLSGINKSYRSARGTIGKLETIKSTKYQRFKKFWVNVYDNLQNKKLQYIIKPLYNDKVNKIETYDLTLTSYDGLKLKGYFAIPYGVKGKKYPGVLLLHGYSSYGTPGWAHFFAIRGYAALSIDVRGHGRSKSVYNPGFPGLMTDGILNVRTFSMFKIIMDSLASLKFLEHFTNINHKLIFVTGGSMGGGISLIDASIDSHVVAAAGDVPFLSDIPIQMPLAKMGPYMEVKEYLKKHPNDKSKVLRSLYYVDVKNFAVDIKSPVLMGIGLKDEDCPPEGSFAVYKLIKSKKYIFIAKNSGHVVLPGWNEAVFKFFAQFIPNARENSFSLNKNVNKRKIL